MEPHLRISVCLALMWSSLLMFFLACLGSVGFVASATSKLPPERLGLLWCNASDAPARMPLCAMFVPSACN